MPEYFQIILLLESLFHLREGRAARNALIRPTVAQNMLQCVISKNVQNRDTFSKAGLTP